MRSRRPFSTQDRSPLPVSRKSLQSLRKSLQTHQSCIVSALNHCISCLKVLNRAVPSSCHRSHFGSRYKLGCCGHAGLFLHRIDSRTLRIWHMCVTPIQMSRSICTRRLWEWATSSRNSSVIGHHCPSRNPPFSLFRNASAETCSLRGVGQKLQARGLLGG